MSGCVWVFVAGLVVGVAVTALFVAWLLTHE